MSEFFRDYSRRDFMQMSLASLCGVSFSSWLPRLAWATSTTKVPKACILLWMPGGPSQTDTFDLKPNHKNGGSVKPIATSVPGIQISERLPKLAQEMHDLAIVRSLTSSEGDHQRGTELMLTGYKPRGGNASYPVLGSLISKELGSLENELPNFVSVSSFRRGSLGAGFLGPAYAPLNVSGQSDDPSARANLSIENLRPPAGLAQDQMENRFDILKKLQTGFRKSHATNATDSQIANYEKAMRMVRTEAKSAFKLQEEPEELREAYGRNRFGQGCLLARRLVERGVTFVEVALSGANNSTLGWDTHSDSANQVGNLCDILDPAWATLMSDLRQRGLLDSTLVIWMGEFGRTPEINQNAGRDHFPLAWSTVLGGAGIQGGQAYGDTGADGMKVVDKPVTVPQLYATICTALGIDYKLENISHEGRPIPIVDEHAEPVMDLIQS